MAVCGCDPVQRNAVQSPRVPVRTVLPRAPLPPAYLRIRGKAMLVPQKSTSAKMHDT